jgi:hypothetical protein
MISGYEAFEHFPIGSKVNLCPAVAAILDFYGKNVSKRFFSETTTIIETKLPRNDHWKVLYKSLMFFMSIGNSRWPPPQYITIQ